MASNSFHCPHCERSYAKQHGLARHITTKHPSPPIDQTSLSSQGPSVLVTQAANAATVPPGSAIAGTHTTMVPTASVATTGISTGSHSTTSSTNLGPHIATASNDFSDTGTSSSPLTVADSTYSLRTAGSTSDSLTDGTVGPAASDVLVPVVIASDKTILPQAAILVEASTSSGALRTAIRTARMKRARRNTIRNQAHQTPSIPSTPQDFPTATASATLIPAPLLDLQLPLIRKNVVDLGQSFLEVLESQPPSPDQSAQTPLETESSTAISTLQQHSPPPKEIAVQTGTSGIVPADVDKHWEDPWTDSPSDSDGDGKENNSRRSVDLLRILSKLRLRDDLEELRTNLRQSRHRQQDEGVDYSNTTPNVSPSSISPGLPSTEDLRNTIEIHTLLNGKFTDMHYGFNIILLLYFRATTRA